MAAPPPDAPLRRGRLPAPTRTCTVALVAIGLVFGNACTDDAIPTGQAVTPSIPVGPGTTTPPSPTTSAPPRQPTSPLLGLEATVIADNLNEPVAVIPAPVPDRLWVVERTGRVVAVNPFAEGSTSEPIEVVLDLTDEVNVEGAEQGLLSIALHPAYPDRGGAYVYLVTAGDDHTELRHYQAAPGHAGRLDATSGQVVLAIDQPHEWHNGGTVVFGPDGYLYLSLGDGGNIGDPHGNGQNPDTMLGGVIRIDIDAAEPYAIPPDNPFLDGGGTPELWVYGLRNPWRISIDRVTNQMVIADVGHDRWEDINVVSLQDGAGSNFGWAVATGPECFQHPTERETEPPPDCDPGMFDAPALSLDRSYGCAVIGGYVYRGRSIPELAGHYVFSDYCRGVLRSIPLADVIASNAAGNDLDLVEHLDGLGRVTSIGVDQRGELLVTTQEGSLLRIVARRS